MIEFVYNNAKNVDIGYIPFELNCDYHSRVFFEKDDNFRLKSCFANKSINELRELMEVCYQNLFYT